MAKELVGYVEPAKHAARTFRVFNMRTLEARFLIADNEEDAAHAEFGPEAVIEVAQVLPATWLVRR